MTNSGSSGPAPARRRSSALSRLFYGSLFLVPLAFAPLRPATAQSAWIPQQRPSSLAQDPQGMDPTSYDWTGLDGVLNQTDGTSEKYKSYFASGSADTQELDLNADISGTAGSWSLGGLSTYKWLWTPPNNAQGVHNDPARLNSDPTQPFPIPRTFVFGVTIPYVEGSYDSAYGTPSIMGSVQDGFDPTWNPVFNLSNSLYASAPANSLDSNTGLFINELPRRRVSLGTTDKDDLNLLDFTLSPGLDVSVDSKGGDVNCYGYGYMQEENSLILLNYPNPYIRPDLGDFSNGAGAGSNQFVYDALPTGTLSVPAQIIVPDAIYQNDFDWLIKPPTGGGAVVDWRFGSTQQEIGGRNTFNLTRQGNPGQYFLAPDTMITEPPVPPATAGQSVPVIKFTGLPFTNAELGTYPVTMTIKTYDPASKATTTNDSHTAYIQTFFQGTASNFPYSKGLYTGVPVETVPPDTYSPPNWYHYYTRLDDIASKYSVPVHYEAGIGIHNNSSYSYPSSSPYIEIHDDAYADRINVPVFDINPVLDPTTGTHFARHIGNLTVQGLFGFIYSVGHEMGHVQTFAMDDGQGNTVYNYHTGEISPYWKLYHHLDPAHPDTTGFYGTPTNTDSTNGDAQLTADVNAVKELFTYSDGLQSGLPQDWSDGGWSYSGLSLPYFAKERYNNDVTSLISGKPPVFYFKFTPSNGKDGLPVAPPAITPVVATDGQYEIRSLADLQALYPGVVIGLDGLSYEAPATTGP